MATGLILSGGIGVRVGGTMPKQYLTVQGKPILIHCMERFEASEEIDAVIVVAAAEWQQTIRDWAESYGLRKLKGFADAGESRQHSIWNGLRKMKALGAGEDDIVVVHDAVRPCVSEKLLRECVRAAEEADGAMPVIAVKDTVYYSADGKGIDELLDRDRLYAGQAPESFRFGKYYAIHEKWKTEDLHKVRGSSEMAYRCGLRIRMIPGDEANFKITTPEDLKKFRKQMEEQETLEGKA